MLITVVIPVYNRARVVGRTLESLDAQSWQDFRVILVDNNSTDGTIDILRCWADNHPGRATLLTEGRRGAAAARQRGLDAVTTEWTLFFDSDDEMLPDHMERVAKAIRRHPDADIIGWNIDMLRDGRKYRTGVFAARDCQYRSLFNGAMATQRYCARTSLFRRAGGWNASLSVWDDIELGARLLCFNPKIVKLHGRPSVQCHLQADSISLGELPANIAQIDEALAGIAASLGPRRAHWPELKRVILAASGRGPEAEALFRRSLAATPAASRRRLLRFAYAWTRRGLPGAAAILRIFM